MTSFGRPGTGQRLRQRIPAWVAVLPLLAMLVLLVACESPGVQHHLAEAEDSTPGSDTPATTGTPAEAPGTPAPDGTDEPTPEDGPDGDVLEGSVEIEQSDFALTPDEFTVKAGEVTFVFVNTGRYTHDFRIEGEGIDVKAPKNGARRTREWSATLEPGTYRISCPISNHDQRGMEGTMVVVE